ncbi:DUF309 domain-containing protein [Streptacidiphilus monticola]|uniref:DUF309 domain-containing protein n=1 Tax=Streptacidiphilus monticola TaxID=2161674 RepID=A0ABW1G3S3_9ACTN
MTSEGGDPACWLNLVCEECGKVRAHPGPTPCEHCGFRPEPEEDDEPVSWVWPVDSAEDGRAGGEPRAEREQDRDRDAAGRARNARPRDGLGRPLPYGVPGVPRQPEGVVRTPAEALAEAQRLLDAGLPFHAHEVLEDQWKAAPEQERRLWRALAQFAVGLTHAARGNAAGAASLLDRAAGGLEPYAAAPPYGIAVAALLAWARGPRSAEPPRLRD